MQQTSESARSEQSKQPAALDTTVIDREQMIAENAYYRALKRGFAPGNEMSDWLEAEADIEHTSETSH